MLPRQAVATDPAAFKAAVVAASPWAVELLLGAWALAEEARCAVAPTLWFLTRLLHAQSLLRPCGPHTGWPLGLLLRCPLWVIRSRRRRSKQGHTKVMLRLNVHEALFSEQILLACVCLFLTISDYSAFFSFLSSEKND